MSRRLTIILIQVSIFALLLIWSANIQLLQAQSPTVTPQPAQTATPVPRPTIPLGVNFWDPATPPPTPLAPSQSLFPTPGAPEHRGGYVLLMKEDVEGKPELITTTINLGLTPIIRYDYESSMAVPNYEDTEALNKWVGLFETFIIDHPQVELFIVGNEPWLERNIKLEQYARAYAALWHRKDSNPTITNVKLLVAGQGAHQDGSKIEKIKDTVTDTPGGTPTPVTTINWPGEVSRRIAQLGAEVDGYAIHAYGFGREYDGEWKGRPQDVPQFARALWNIAVTPSPDGTPIPSCPAPWQADQACDYLGGGWPGDDGFLNFQDQLASLPPEFAGKPVYITEYNTNAWGEGTGDLSHSQHEPISPYVPANNYPAGWIIDAAKSVDAYNSTTPPNRIEGMMWFVGSPHGEGTVKINNVDYPTDWRYFALTPEDDTRRLPCARQDFQYATGAVNTPCQDQDSKPPDLQATLQGCPANGINADASDDQSGANKLTTQCFAKSGKPNGDPYPLSQTTFASGSVNTYYFPKNQSTDHFYRTFNLVPPVGGYCIFTLYDNAGNFTRQKVDNPGPQHCYNGSAPGGDHPDDNDSATVSTLTTDRWYTMPSGARADHRVAILNRGFPQQLWETMFKLGEPAVMLSADFDPAATARQYPALLIPSGGLYGLENSEVFRRRLELYAEAGGTIVAFAQQHGYEFGVLPGGKDGSLTAYGWQEDNSCYEASLRLAANHPSLAGFSQTALTAHVDGYFNTIPAGAAALLTRNQNGAPGTILYPYGQGRVIATSMYDDWGAANGQLSADAQTFLRDLLSWAVEPADIPTYAPGATMNVPAEVTNDTEYEAVAVRFSLINPAREIVETRVVTTTLAAGAAATLEFTPSAPVSAPLGIWRVDATLLNERGLPLGPRVAVGRFSIANPPSTVAADRPFDLNITAPGDHFPTGSRGEFTFHVYNRTESARTVTVRYGLPHHTWEIGNDPNTGLWYGRFYGLSRELEVPAQSEATFVYSPTIALNQEDRLWAMLDEGGQTWAYASFAVFPLPAEQVKVAGLRSLPSVASRGGPVELEAEIRNVSPYPLEDLAAGWSVTDAEGQTLYSQDVPLGRGFVISPNEQRSLSTTFTLPLTAASGVAVAHLNIYNGMSQTGGRATFRVSPSPLSSRLPDDLSLTPNRSQSVPLRLTNLSPFVAVTQGRATLTLLDNGDPIANGSADFSLAAGQDSTVDVELGIPQLEFGSQRYRLQVDLSDEHGQQSWQTDDLPLAFSAETAFDRAEYRIRDTAAVTLTLRNPGPFVQTFDLALIAPDLNFEEHRPVTLEAGQYLTQTYEIPVSTNALTGGHPLTVSAMLPNSSQLELAGVGTIYIPASRLQAAVSGQPTGPGDELKVPAANVGGVDTTAAYDLSIYDNRSFAVSTVAGQEPVAAGQPLTVPLTIPGQFRSGPYNLAGSITDQSTGQVVSVYQALNLNGLVNQIATQTNAETYLTTHPITATAIITNTGLALDGGRLTMRIVNAGPVESAARWVNYTTADGLADNNVIDAAVDGAGNKWFAHAQQLSWLSPGGNWDTSPPDDTVSYQTIAAAGQSVWVGTSSGAFTFDGTTPTWLIAGEGQNPVCVQGQTINDIAVDAAGRVWFATDGNRLCVLDSNGTPANLADDTWAQFNTANGSPTRLAIDGAGHIWAVTGNGLDVLDYGSDPFNPADDAWARVPSPLYWQSITALAIDNAGIVWLGASDGLYRLNDGGTNPFENTADDSWTTINNNNDPDFPANDLTDNRYIRALAFDQTGNLWIGTDYGVSILSPGKQWHNYTPLDGLGSGIINAIAVDADGNRWLATSPDNKPYGEGFYDYPGGVTAAIGAGLPESSWKTYTADTSGLAGDQLTRLAADPAGNVWLAGYYSGRGASLPVKPAGLASPLWEQRGDIFIQRLAPGNSWAGFSTPPFASNTDITDMAVDAAGQVWLAADNPDNSEGELVALLPLQNTWATRRPAELKGRPRALAVAGTTVWAAFDSISIDDRFYPEGLAVYSLSDHTWTVVYRGSQDEMADHPQFHALATTPAGEVWTATDQGVWRLSADGATRSTYTAENSQLAGNNVGAIAIDRQGNRWFATSGGVSVLSANGSQWATFSTVNAASLAVDTQGKIWFGNRSLDYGASPFDPVDDVWTVYDQSYDLGNKAVADIAVDETGQVWFATGGQGLTRYAPPATVGRILWQHSAEINANALETVPEVAGLTAAELGATGKFYLEAALATNLGQPLGAARYPFYIFPTQTGLTLATDRAVYRPNQVLTLSGQIRNGAALPLTQTLTLTMNGRVVYTETGITVPAESSYPFTVTTMAPAEPGPVIIGAAFGEQRVEDNIVIATPRLNAHLNAPELVGHAPFDLRLTLTNPGKLDLDLTAGRDDQTEALTLPAGETRIISGAKQIEATTVITAQVSGDVAASLTRTVRMGEAGHITITPETLYPVGRVEIPYALTNTGEMPLAFSLGINLYAGASPVQTGTLAAALPVGGAKSGRLAFDLPAGDYRLEYRLPLTAADVSLQPSTFRVAALNQVALKVQTQTPVEANIPLTITAANSGARAVTGDIKVETDFFDAGLTGIELLPGQTITPTVSVETANAAPGSYPVTVTMVAANGTALATQTLTVTVLPPRMTLDALPSPGAPLTPGQVATITFGVRNSGGSAGAAVLHVTLADFINESQLISLEPGASGSLDFSFYLPPELVAGDYIATYVLSNTITGEVQRGEVTLNVAGLDVAVTSALDKAVYTPGETANLTLNVANQAGRPTPNLYALARFGNAVVTQTFTLAGNGEQTLNLAVPVADEGVADTLFYGIYDQDSSRGVYLNTTHLYRLNSVATLYPGQAVYAPGATVQVTVATTATGLLLVHAPGYSQTLTLNGGNTNFNFTLPGNLTRGTYTIDYTLAGFLPRSTAFDVAGPWVRVTEARMAQLPEAPGNPVALDLTVASETAEDVVLRSWLLYPDGTQSAAAINPVALQARLNNHASLDFPLETDQAGPHRLVYHLTSPDNPDQVYASGVEEFDIGNGVVLSVYMDQDDYLNSDDTPQLVATLVASATTAAQIKLEVDGVEVTSQNINLAPGSQTITLPVSGEMTPGWHTARVRMNADGLSSVAETRFVYKAFGPDLVVRSPRLFKPSGYTATLYAYVYNLGDQPSSPSTLWLYDGDPAANGRQIAAVTVPAMPAKKPFYNDTQEFFVTWNVTGLAGLHTVYAVADAGQTVSEINEDNNTASATVDVPALSLAVSTDQETYQPGEPVNMTVGVANLQAGGTQNITLTTTADLLGYKPFQVEESVTVPAGELVERHYTWPVTATYGGTYNLIAEATGDIDPVREYAQFTLPVGAEFTATPLTGTVPLSITFADLSSPWGWVESWQWDFGDDQTSTESNPRHLYEIPGNYTVTLTTTVGLSTYVRLKPNYITVTGVITPVAAFRADAVTGLNPMTVIFTDTSTGTIITRTWDFGDNTSTVITTAMTLSHTYSFAGVYTPTLTVAGPAGSDVLSWPAGIVAVAPQSSGTFALEAEDYARRLPGTGAAWQTRTIHPGYSGNGYVQTWPDGDALFATTPISASSELHYGLGLTVTGTYTIWLRGYAENSAGDSVYIGLDGQPINPDDYISAYPPDEWAWRHTLVESGQPATFTVDAPGAHLLQIRAREDGFCLDQIILTNDKTFTPGD